MRLSVCVVLCYHCATGAWRRARYFILDAFKKPTLYPPNADTMTALFEGMVLSVDPGTVYTHMHMHTPHHPYTHTCPVSVPRVSKSKPGLAHVLSCVCVCVCVCACVCVCVQLRVSPLVTVWPLMTAHA